MQAYGTEKWLPDKRYAWIIQQTQQDITRPKKLKQIIFGFFDDMKERIVLFNNTINTFYLRLYGVRQLVKYHSDSERKPAAATWATLSD